MKIFIPVLILIFCGCSYGNHENNSMKSNRTMTRETDILSIGFNTVQHDILSLSERYGFTYRIVGVGSVKGKGMVLEKDTYYWPEHCKRYEEDIVAEIRQQLESPPKVIVMTMRPPWNAYPEDLRREIMTYVANGGSLLIFGPDKTFRADLKEASHSFASPFEPLDGKDKFAPEIHPCRQGLIAVLPSQGDYRKVLLTPDTAEPDYFEYQFARIANLINYLIRREKSNCKLTFDSAQISLLDIPSEAANIRVTVFNRDGQLASYENKTRISCAMPNGRNTVLAALYDRENNLLEVVGGRKEIRNQAAVKSLSFGNDKLSKHQPFELRIKADAVPDGELELDFVDHHQRVFYRQKFPAGDFTVKDIMPDTSLSVLNRAVVSLKIHGKLVDRRVVEFTLPDNIDKKDFYLFTWHGAVDTSIRQLEYAKGLKKYGVDGFSNMNIFDYGARGAALANMLAIPYATGFHNITLESLFSPEWVREQTDRALKAAVNNRPYGGFGFTLGDENYISPFKDKGRFCDDPVVWAQFQQYLRGEYRDLTALNRQWDTRYSAWEEIRFGREEELFSIANPSAWVDFRQFISSKYISVQKGIAGRIKELLPNAYVGWDGAEQFSSYDGYDLYPYVTEFNMNNVYGRYFTPGSSPPKVFNGHCLRSFAARDSLTGFWLNSLKYPYGISYTIYSALFSGYNSAWWWYSTFPGFEIGALDYDYRPNQIFRQVRSDVDVVKSGLATVVRNSVPRQSTAAVYYSTHNWHASNLSSGVGSHINNLGVSNPLWFAGLPGRYVNVSPEFKQMWSGITNLGHYAFSSVSFFQLLQDMQISFDMVDGRRIAAGDLSRYQVLILPFVESLAGGEVKEIRNFVKNGGIVIADYRCGIRDEHCKFRANGALDDVFGIEQKFPFKTNKRDQKVRVDNNVDRGFSLPILFNQELTLDGGRSYGSGDDSVPGFIVNKYGKGHAVYLNFDIYGYLNQSTSGNNGEFCDFIYNFVQNLTGKRLSRPVRDVSGRPLDRINIFRYTDGSVDYAAAIRDYQDSQPKQGYLEFAEKGHLYDIMNHRYLGHSDRVKLTFHPAAPMMIARYPYQIKGIESCAEKFTDRIVLSMEVTNHDHKPSQNHTVYIKVYDPEGARVDYLSKPLYLKDGKGTCTIPLALNSPPGEWKFEVTELASGICARPVTGKVRVGLNCE